MHVTTNAADRTLDREELLSRLRSQAARLETLWRVANAGHDLTDEDALQAVLSEGAAAIRPGQTFFGSLMRVEGDDCVLLAAARSENVVRSMRDLAHIGARFPTAQLPQRLAISSGMTLSWDDCAKEPAIAGLPKVRELGIRAQICSPFEVGRTTYVLNFASTSPTTDPFRTDDHTYINLLAGFFAGRIQRDEHSLKLLHHMSHDALTGLRNRTQFRLDARGLLAQHGRGALVVISLDGYRAINEEYGHIIGDALLVEVGAALERTLTGSEVAGRLAGDTFGAFLSFGAGGEHGARERIERLSDVFTRPFSTGDREGKEYIPLSATIGAAFGDGDGETIDRLLSHADTAVFAAKQRGRGRLEFYRPGMESEAASRARTSTEISRGIASGQFELFIQPHLDVGTMRVAGAEALIRWNHPAKGLVLPDAFIPFAERHGLIRTITRWVMEAALEASQRLRTIDPAFRLYFNLSASDFSDAAILDELDLAGARGANLENIGVELTETAAMQDLGSAIRTVRHLQDLGVRVAIDDYGTGYSSLALLKRLPVDVIKIDHSFISEVLLGERDAVITAAVIASGKELGYETVGEGVETDAQLAWLRERGCRYVQGYAVARPQPLDAFVAWLARRNPPA
jgi:diguanylate cyclase (GGDEF)-like protein